MPLRTFTTFSEEEIIEFLKSNGHPIDEHTIAITAFMLFKAPDNIRKSIKRLLFRNEFHRITGNNK